MRPLLVIAGFDPSGNAGILRDAAIAGLCGVGVSAVPTALTAQNQKKFFSTNVVSPAVFRWQLESVMPFLQYGAVKMGMMGGRGIIGIILEYLKRSQKIPPLVLDPVFESSTGGCLLDEAGRKILFHDLVPHAALWTPNLFEAAHFSGKPVKSEAAVEKTAEFLFSQNGTPLLIKGFKSGRTISDLYFDGNISRWFEHPYLKVKGLRGTGCALASFIASHLALGHELKQAVALSEKKMQKWIQCNKNGLCLPTELQRDGIQSRGAYWGRPSRHRNPS